MFNLFIRIKCQIMLIFGKFTLFRKITLSSKIRDNLVFDSQLVIDWLLFLLFLGVVQLGACLQNFFSLNQHSDYQFPCFSNYGCF